MNEINNEKIGKLMIILCTLATFLVGAAVFDAGGINCVLIISNVTVLYHIIFELVNSRKQNKMEDNKNG